MITKSKIPKVAKLPLRLGFKVVLIFFYYRFYTVFEVDNKSFSTINDKIIYNTQVQNF